jgi:hypothetical protein
MNKIALLGNEYVKLWYHPEPKIIHHEILNSPPSAIFREMLTKGAECLEQHGATKWLSDDSRNKLVQPEDNVWGDTVWAPRVIKAGFKFWAIVLPKQALGHLQMQRFCREYRARGVVVELFEKTDAALKWLTSSA